MSQLPMFIDLARCRIWPGHPRRADALTPEACADLIAGIRAEGQLTPAIIRPIGGDARAGFEIICGARRYAAIKALAARGEHVHFVVAVRTLTDEEAFRLADSDGRKQCDLSDHERATAYAAALRSHYGGSQRRMAKALCVTETWLSRYLALAALPPGIVAAFGDPARICTRHAARLRAVLQDPLRREAAIEYAVAWEAAQTLQRQSGRPPICAAEIVRQLAAGLPPSHAEPASHTVRHSAGHILATGKRRLSGAIQVELSPGTSPSEAAAALQQIMSHLAPPAEQLAHVQTSGGPADPGIPVPPSPEHPHDPAPEQQPARMQPKAKPEEPWIYEDDWQEASHDEERGASLRVHPPDIPHMLT